MFRKNVYCVKKIQLETFIFKKNIEIANRLCYNCNSVTNIAKKGSVINEMVRTERSC